MPYPTDNLPVCISSITVNSWGNAPKLGKKRKIFHPASQRSYERNFQKIVKYFKAKVANFTV